MDGPQSAKIAASGCITAMTDAGPKMWKVDPLAAHQERLEAAQLLHREAGRRGYSTNPKQSNIDKRYFAEINEVYSSVDGRYEGTQFNVAMGTGDTPLEAALEGYRAIVPIDDIMACVYLEVELVLLSAAVARARAREKVYSDFDHAIDDLIGVLRDRA